MPTHLTIDDHLMAQAQRLGRHRTKKDTVNSALREYVKLQQRQALLEEEGQVDFWPGFDAKRLRRDRPKR